MPGRRHSFVTPILLLLNSQGAVLISEYAIIRRLQSESMN